MEKITRKLEKVIIGYIPKNDRCRFDEQKRQVKREKEKNIILSILSKNEMFPEVEVTDNWENQGPDMSVCATCKEMIYGQQYELKYYLNGEQIEQENTVKVCEPCYMKMDK